MSTERFNEALLSLRTAQSLSPQMPFASGLIGFILMFEGKPGAALIEFNQETFEQYALEGQALAHFALGQTSQSDAALTKLIEKYEKVGALEIADVLAFRKEFDRAFRWLDKAVQNNNTGLTLVNCLPIFENLYNDPRWLQFIQRIGVAPEQVDAIELTFPLPR